MLFLRRTPPSFLENYNDEDDDDDNDNDDNNNKHLEAKNSVALSLSGGSFAIHIGNQLQLGIDHLRFNLRIV